MCVRVFLAVRVEQLCSDWMDFYEITHISDFQKSVKEIQISVKSDKNNRYFTWQNSMKFSSSRRSHQKIYKIRRFGDWLRLHHKGSGIYPDNKDGIVLRNVEFL